MKKTGKRLPIKQIIKLVKAHLSASVLIFIFATMLSGALYGENKIPLVIFSIISLLTYFLSIYSESYAIARQDNKRYTAEEPYMLKGFLLSIGVVILTIILYVIYYFIQKYVPSPNIWTLISGIVYVVWTYPFNEIIGLNNGAMAWYGYIIVVFVPVLLSGLGYIAGLKNFDISEKISKFIYEKKE